MALEKLIALIIFGLIGSSCQQVWKNNKIVWGQPQANNQVPPLGNYQPPNDNSGQGTLIGYNFQQQTNEQQNEGNNLFVQNAPSFFYPHPSPVEISAQGPVNVAPVPVPQPAVVAPASKPVVVDKAPAQPAQSGPYDIKHETITSSGQKIVENLIGGVSYNCADKPTGHFRDSHFCDVFHACVFGQQQKTYACPFVGEAQYFDDVTRKCEFVRSNPEACASNAFFH